MCFHGRPSPTLTKLVPHAGTGRWPGASWLELAHKNPRPLPPGVSGENGYQVYARAIELSWRPFCLHPTRMNSGIISISHI